MPFQKSENPGAKRIEVWASTAFVRACNADMRTCGHASKYSCQQPKTYGLPSENAKVKPLFRKQLDMIQWNSVEHLHLRWCSPSHRGSITFSGSIQCCLQTLCSPLGRSRAEQRRDDLLSGTVALNGLNGRSQWLLDDVGKCIHDSREAMSNYVLSSMCGELESSIVRAD